MRLIDADKVKQYALAKGFYCDTDADKKATAEEIDQLFPTVEAIPMEWITQWLLKNCHNEKGHYVGDGYDTVEDMLEDWRKENG